LNGSETEPRISLRKVSVGYPTTNSSTTTAGRSSPKFCPSSITKGGMSRAQLSTTKKATFIARGAGRRAVLVVAQCANVTEDCVKANLGVRKCTLMASRWAQSESTPPLTITRSSLGGRGSQAGRRIPPRNSKRQLGHTPLSTEEEIPWKCHRLVCRQRCIRQIARDAISTARGRAPQDQVARLVDPRSDRDIESRARKHECHSARDLLTLGIFASGTWPIGRERNEAPLILGSLLNVWEIVGREFTPRGGIPSVVD
jgi:hypothetical protein